MAIDFKNKKVKKSVMNSEPCYEGYSHGDKYGRFNEKETL
jgi:hypothetical protein